MSPFNVGHYPKISVKSLYDEFAKRPEVEPYMPPKVHKGRTLDKKYFWDVVGTLFPDEVDAMVKHANSSRHSLEDST